MSAVVVNNAGVTTLSGGTVSVANTSNGRRKRKSQSYAKVWFAAAECKYPVILEAVRALGWKVVLDEKSDAAVNVFWVDVASIHERFRSILPWQMINHFPGMPNIARKNRLGQNLNRMQKIYPREYAFYPRTWVLPSELSDFRTQFDHHGNSLGNKIFIIKPDAGCQGRGIFLTRTYDTVPTNENVVAQVYIKKPLLIDGFKFDLRIYCLVTSVKPLRVYLFNDGLVRLCTEQYVKPTKQNLDNACMHLTNYAVNKNNAAFTQPGEEESAREDSSKRALQWFMDGIISKHGADKANQLWRRIGTLCVRTILSIMPTLAREYDQHFKAFEGIPQVHSPGLNGMNTAGVEENNDEGRDMGGDGSEEVPAEDEKRDGINGSAPLPSVRGCRCFEILGLDIMIDTALRPTLIEVNHLPSFGTDSPLDKDVKSRLMKQVLPCLSAQADDEQAFAAFHKREAERRLNSERKGREKELERQREERAAEEREAAEKRRKWRLRELERAARLRQQMEVAKAEAEAAVALALREQRGDDGEVCSPERMIEIKDILRQLYERFAVEKLSKIDKLLSKYHGREEEFLRFALEKYCPSFLEHMETNAKAKEDAAAEASMEQELQETEELQQLAEAGEEDGEGSSDANAATSSAYHATNRPLVTYSSGSSPTARHLTSTASRVTAAKPARSTFGGRFTRSLSPSHSSADKELKKHWKDSDPGEEEQLKAKVLSQFVPSSEDAWLRYEAAHLLEFTRIYPLPPPLNKDALGEGEKQVMEMGAEDDQEASDDGEAAEETEASGAITISKQQPRFKAASFEDIMVQVFLQDRRQVLRLHGPMALHRSNSVDDGNKASSTTNGARETQSLPPLTSHSNDGSCPLPTTASNTGTNKAPSSQPRDKELIEREKRQQEATLRLNKGVSAYRSPLVADNSFPPRSPYYPHHQQQQSYVEDSFSNAQDTVQYSAATNRFGNPNGVVQRRGFPHPNRTANGAGAVLPAHSVRPQLFHFDPIEAEQAAASTTAFSRENHLTAMGGGAAKSGRGMSSIGVGIVGRPVPRLEQQGGFRSGEVFGQSVEGNTNNSMAPDRRAQLSAHKRSANLSANNLPGPSGDQFSSRGFGVPHHQEGGGIKNLFPNFF